MLGAAVRIADLLQRHQRFVDHGRLLGMHRLHQVRYGGFAAQDADARGPRWPALPRSRPGAPSRPSAAITSGAHHDVRIDHLVVGVGELALDAGSRAAQRRGESGLQ